MDEHKPHPSNKTIPIKVTKEELETIKKMFSPSVIRPNRTRAEYLRFKLRRFIQRTRAEIRRFYYRRVY